MSTTAGVFIWAIGHCVSNTECRLAPGLKGTLNRPGVSRRLLCLSPGHFGWDVLTVVEVFELCWQDVAEFTEEAAVVEPVDPLEGGEFEVVDTPPRALVSNQFCLVETEQRHRAAGRASNAPRSNGPRRCLHG
jgi:hypothetical protein